MAHIGMSRGTHMNETVRHRNVPYSLLVGEGRVTYRNESWHTC